MRLSKNYTQNYVADELGIDVTNYSRLERGETQISIERLYKMAKIFETDICSLLSNVNEIDETNNQEHLKSIFLELKELNINVGNLCKFLINNQHK